MLKSYIFLETMLLNLPVELIARIAELVDPDDLLNWMLTSRHICASSVLAQQTHKALLRFQKINFSIFAENNYERNEIGEFLQVFCKQPRVAVSTTVFFYLFTQRTIQCLRSSAPQCYLRYPNIHHQGTLTGNTRAALPSTAQFHGGFRC